MSPGHPSGDGGCTVGDTCLESGRVQKRGSRGVEKVLKASRLDETSKKMAAAEEKVKDRAPGSHVRGRGGKGNRDREGCQENRREPKGVWGPGT